MGRPRHHELPDVDRSAGVERVAGPARLQADLPKRRATSSVSRPSNLHGRSPTRARHRPVCRHRCDHDGSVPRARGPRAVLLQWLRERPAGARRLLRPPLRHEAERSGETGSDQLPRGAVTRRDAARVFALAAILNGGFGAAWAQQTASIPQSRRQFVACPIVRDTRTQPCWLAEYDGELYYLGQQGGVANDFYPPQLGHLALVEGTLRTGRVCGGIPLQ